jgi:hypothetical protein
MGISGKEPTIKVGKKQSPLDTVITDIPNDTLEQRVHNKLLNVFNLMSLSNGYSGYQVRVIYPGEKKSDPLKAVIIKKDSNNYLVEFRTVIFNRDSINGQMIFSPVQIKYMQPKSGWNQFFKVLISTGIDSIHSYQTYTGKTPPGGKTYYVSTHASIMEMEIATRKVYKYVEYPDFYSNEDRFEDTKKFGKLLRLIENEFQFKLREK